MVSEGCRGRQGLQLNFGLLSRVAYLDVLVGGSSDFRDLGEGHTRYFV